MNVGQQSGIIVPPAPEQNNEVSGLLRLAGDPNLAKKLEDFYKAWDDAHKANKEILKSISRARSLKKAEEKVAQDQESANRAMSDANNEAKRIVDGAQASAAEILDRVQNAGDGLGDREDAVKAAEKALMARDDATAKLEKSLNSREKTLATGREQLNAERKAFTDQKARVRAAYADGGA